MELRVSSETKIILPPEGLSRREMLERGLIGVALVSGVSALLAGCSSGSSQRAELPGVKWPDEPLRGKTRSWRPLSESTRPAPMPQAPVGVPSGVIPRSAWAKGAPVPALMDRAQPYYRITVHHDGMNTFTSTDQYAAAQRLEQIRQAHRQRDFGDIGYHYVIDPAGRVWQGRPLEWQGAHVKATNQGNLGICMLGNYQQQSPNPQQLAALDRFVTSQMRTYNISLSDVRTHQEMAPTLCPGSTLQVAMVRTRRNGALASA